MALDTTTLTEVAAPNTFAPKTSKEAIAANVQILIEQLEAGKSEGLRQYLTAMGRFHSYSFGNILEIARQKPDATHVAGFQTWKGLNRSVKKGEKGIRILAPMLVSRKKKDKKSEEQTEKPKPVLVGFRSVYVFDISQTEGESLPGFSAKISGTPGEYQGRLLEFTRSQGIQLEFSESIAPALGMSYGGRITLLPGQAPAEEFSTLVHELAHELLHKGERRSSTTQTIRETEAEAVAFVVAQSLGLDAGRSSADYIQLYNGDATVLTESLAAIQKASALIMDALFPKQEGEQSESPAL